MKSLKNTLIKAAKNLTTVEFTEMLNNEYPKLLWIYEDADNLLDYNQGNFNIYVFKAETQLWFYDGVLVNVNGEEL